MKSLFKTRLVVAGISAALSMPVVFAQAAAGLDYSTAASDMKTQALAALGVIGLAVLAVAAAFAAFRRGKSIVK
jgi:hypothetical protein